MEKAFRVKQKNGTYEWREVVLLMIPGTDAEEFLLCFKTLPNGLNLDGKSYTTEFDYSNVERTYSTIWENLVWNSDIKFFWKDSDRRFRGVSQSFLDFYGIKSRDDILGKNDEDMARVNRIEGPSRVDNITNLMNARSFLDAMTDMQSSILIMIRIMD